MKHLILVGLLIFISLGFSGISNKEINGTEQNWTAGVCCRKGVNYELNFKIKNKKTEQLKIESVCLNDIQFKELRIKTEKDKKYTHYSLSFVFLKDDTTSMYYQSGNFSPIPDYEKCTSRVINYQYKGNLYQWKIGALSKLPTLSYP